jgi:cell division protein FtsL
MENQKQPIIKEDSLRELLFAEAQKEQRAYKRTIMRTVVIALVGLVWLVFSAYNVVKLQRESSKLNAQIQGQTTELSTLQTNINKAKEELAATTQQLGIAKNGLAEAEKGLNEATRALTSIASGKEEPQVRAQRALPTVNKASRAVEISKAESAKISTATLFTPPSVGVNTKPSQKPVQPPPQTPAPMQTPALTQKPPWLLGGVGIIKVPNVKGKLLQEAMLILKETGLKYDTQGKGIYVMDQSPSAGKAVGVEATVHLRLTEVMFQK